MGNRAVIRFDYTSTKEDWKGPEHETSLYLHWNGGRDSVEAFLTYARLTGASGGTPHAILTLSGIIRNFFGAGALSMGLVGPDYDGEDNGIYVVNAQWKIIDRINAPHHEQNKYNLAEMLEEIDEAQPGPMQLGKGFLQATETDTNSLDVGEQVYVQDFTTGTPALYTIIGHGTPGKIVNGCDVGKVPYINRWGYKHASHGKPEDNINNYLRTKTVRVPTT